MKKLTCRLFGHRWNIIPSFIPDVECKRCGEYKTVLDCTEEELSYLTSLLNFMGHQYIDRSDRHKG